MRACIISLLIVPLCVIVRPGAAGEAKTFEGIFRKAVELKDTGRKEESLKEFERALAVSLESGDGGLNAAKAHAMRAILHNERDAHDDAEKSLRACGEIADRMGPNSEANAWYSWALAERQFSKEEYVPAMRNTEKALSVFRDILGEDSRYAGMQYSNLGFGYAKKGDYDRAMDYYRKALAISLKTLGENHTNTAHCYNGFALVCHDRGDYGKAIEYYEKALAIDAKILGENHGDLSNYYACIGQSHMQRGEHDRVITCFEKALAIDRKNRGENHPYVASDYSNLGTACYHMGDYRRAVEYYEKALAIEQKLPGNNSGKMIVRYCNLGAAYANIANYDKAIESYEKALSLQLRATGQDDPEVATLYSDIGGAYLDRGDYRRAIEYYEKALAIERNLPGGNSRKIIIRFINLGLAWMNDGDYDRAIDYYKRALVLHLKTTGKDNPEIAALCNNLGAAYHHKGEYDWAIVNYMKALEIDTKRFGERHLNVANACNNIGSTYVESGEYDKAIPYFEKAIAIMRSSVGDNDARTAIAYNNMGGACHHKGEYDRAIEYYRKAIAISLKLLGENHPDVSRSYSNLGVAYLNKGDHRKAIEYYEKALSIDLKVFHENHPNVAVDCNNIGGVFNERRDSERAIKYFARALSIGKKTGARQETILYAKNLGMTYLDRNDPVRAKSVFSDAISVIESARLQTGAGKTEFMARNIVNYYFSLKASALMSDLGAVFSTAEAMRARGFLDRLGLSAALSVEGIDRKDRERMLALSDRIDYLSGRRSAEIRKPADKQDRGVILKLTEELEEKEKELSVLNQALLKNERYRNLSMPKIAGLKDAEGLCDDKTAILEYVIWEEKDSTSAAFKHKQSYCMVIKKGGTALVPLDRDFDYTDAVMKYREAVVRDTSSRGVNVNTQKHDDPDTQGTLLYEKLIVPVEKHIGAARNIVIVPDGALAFLPFDSLRRDGKGKYLCEQYAVTLAPSVSVMLMTRGREFRAQRRAMLAFGGGLYSADGSSANRGSGGGIATKGMSEKQKEYMARRASDGRAVFYYDGRGLRWKDLPGTGDEVSSIDSRVYAKNGTRILTGEDVTEEKVKALSGSNELASYKALHFACHGYYDQEFPAFSAVVFSEVSGKVKTREDGYLSVEEAALLKLNADIVNLSACETGLGKMVKGDGVVGLARAFQVAGANRVGVTLWQVDDEATKEFMVRVYSRVVKDGMSFGAAFNATKREFISSKEYAKYRAPYYWSPFVLYGE